VAEVGGRPVGSRLFVRREIDPLHDLTSWLAGLAVAGHCRGQGLGRALVKAIERHAVAVGCRKLHLYTEKAEPFYTSPGWVVVDRLTVEGAPLVPMSRETQPEGTTW